MEHFRVGNPPLHYSGYPGSEYPHQCGKGFGYGGYGQYGTYGSCATYDHYKMNKIDYNDEQPALGWNCGGQVERPVVSDCNAPEPVKPATPCACDVVKEDFHGGEGCAKPEWLADQGCKLPPQHCGAGSCTGRGASYGATGHWQEGIQAGFETFDPCISAYGDDAHSKGDLPAPTCGAPLKAQHRPGCQCVKCLMPYSAPYAAGPGCGKEWCNCHDCDGDCDCDDLLDNAMDRVRSKMSFDRLAEVRDRLRQRLVSPTTRNVIIALIVALIAYRYFR